MKIFIVLASFLLSVYAAQIPIVSSIDQTCAKQKVHTMQVINGAKFRTTTASKCYDDLIKNKLPKAVGKEHDFDKLKNICTQKNPYCLNACYESMFNCLKAELKEQTPEEIEAEEIRTMQCVCDQALGGLLNGIIGQSNCRCVKQKDIPPGWKVYTCVGKTCVNGKVTSSFA